MGPGLLLNLRKMAESDAIKGEKNPWLKLDLIFHAIISQNSIKVCKL